MATYYQATIRTPEYSGRALFRIREQDELLELVDEDAVEDVKPADDAAWVGAEHYDGLGIFTALSKGAPVFFFAIDAPLEVAVDVAAGAFSHRIDEVQPQ